MQLLLRWQPSAQHWEFIVSERLDNEGFREALVREVAWQLQLNRGSDFLVSSMAQLTMESMEPPAEETAQPITVAFYSVQVYRRSVIDFLENDSSNRWVSAAEVCKGETSDGQAIHPQVVKWINQWEVVQPWQ